MYFEIGESTTLENNTVMLSLSHHMSWEQIFMATGQNSLISFVLLNISRTFDCQTRCMLRRVRGKRGKRVRAHAYAKRRVRTVYMHRVPRIANSTL